MALITTRSRYALGSLRMPEPQGAEIVCVRMTHDLVAAPLINDTLWLGDLPARCVPVDCLFDSDDLDSNGAPAVTMSVGFLNAAKTDLASTAWIVSSNIGQASGMARPTTSTLVKSAVSNADQPVGIKFTAAPATFQAGTVGLTLFYRAAHSNQ